MKRLLSGFAVLAVFACTPDIPNTPPPTLVTAQFDPSAVPAIVPTPNDLAFSPTTGQLNITVAEDAAAVDKEFVGYLNSLNGFPAGSSANATFDGALDPASVSAQSVRVLDLTGGFAPVSGVAVSYADVSTATAAGRVTVRPPAGGWTPGKSYAVVLIGGASGLKGASGQQVVGSATFAFIRSKASLVTCTDLAAPDCRTTTEVIPSDQEDPALRLKDQTAKALQLERLRLKYAPGFNALEAANVPRADVALLWTFKVADYTQVVFNPAATPPQVPVPNDLAIDPATGLVNAPIDPMAPEAQREFTRDYLNTLNGFPTSAGAAAALINGDLDPATVNASTVKVIELSALGMDAGTPVVPTIAYDSATHQIKVSPPATGWGKSKKFAVAVLSGSSGVKRMGGGKVIGSDVWALARSKASLVTCASLTAPDCAPAITLAPLSSAEAVRLEGLRRAYAPVLDLLQAQGVPRADVAILWVFSTVDQAEPVFNPNPLAPILPFPNDLAMNQTTGRVNLPIPPGAPQALTDLITGLNTLDGFSTVGALVSENSETLGATDFGTLDGASLTAATANVIKLSPMGGNPAKVKACLNCVSSLLPDGGTPASPQQLQLVPEVPLDEKTRYGAFITTGVKDARGKALMAPPAFALIRSSAPLVDSMGKSQVSGVPDIQAAGLEPLRLALKPFFDGLTQANIPRSKIALAWTFTTQSTVAILKQLHALPTATSLSTDVTYLADVTSTTTIQENNGASVSKVFQGSITVPFLLTGPGGTLNPASTRTQRAPFVLTLPTGTAPGTGWPVVLFGHGLGSSRMSALHIAEAFAQKKIATLAIDIVFHGERTVCTGAKAVLGAPSDDAACADPTTQMCDAATGRCVARVPATRAACVPSANGDLTCAALGQGQCLPVDNVCEGGDFLRLSAGGPPAISSWNFLSVTNFFATRDNFRHPVADLAQVVRVLKATGPGSLNGKLTAAVSATLDPAKIHYAGQSLGAITGTLFVAASPDIHRAGLNVPTGDVIDVLFTSPAFGPQRTGFLASLAGLGLTPGKPGFDQFIYLARTIIDPADAQNAGFSAVNAAAPADRKAFIQYIEPDLTLPNPTTLKLIAAGNQNPAKSFAVYKFVPAAGEFTSPARHHDFLLHFPQEPSTTTAQSQLSTFVETGVTP